jgi:uncharacterized NAD(P)/FAD-binding protein YdhS
MSQAAFWEIIAVPDIRLQTAALAKMLLARIAAHFLTGVWERPERSADKDERAGRDL